MNELVIKSNRMMKLNKEDFRSNRGTTLTVIKYIAENFKLNNIDSNGARSRGHKKALSVPHDLSLPPRVVPVSQSDKNKIYPFKHPLISISKPSKEEIEQSKERQRRRNLSQQCEEDFEHQYNDGGTSNIAMNINFNMKNLNSIFSSGRFFTKRSMIYNTYLSEGINCSNVPRYDMMIPTSRCKLLNSK